MKTPYLKTFLLLTIGISIASCGASKQQAMLDTIHSPQARPATMDALNEDFNSAEKDQVNLISPKEFTQAKKSFAEAAAKKAQGLSEDKYSDNMADARKNLDLAMAFAKANKDKLSPLVTARETALSSGAADTINTDLKSLEKRYLDVVSQIGGINGRRAEKQIPELTKDYQALTVKTIENKYLGEALNNLEIAKKEGADKLVPKTLKQTEETIQKAKDLIALDQKPESIPKIAQSGDEASAASVRLLALTRQTKNSTDLSPEDVALKAEAALNTTKAKSADLQNDLTGSQKRISELETKTKKLSQLEQKEEKNKKFENVRQLFDDSEAKVYRQGDSLVISLKKINFAVNKSDIPSDSFVLLKKVQSAIRSFKEPSVVVEGHTDSSGNADLNKTLSEKRAEAVKSYFLSNSVLPPEKVVAVGYGSEKPLASNKSNSGRAINRRIDIVIKD